MLYSDINGNDAFNNPILIDLDAVIQSVINLMTIKRTELVFLPEFGIDAESYLFEFIDEVGALLLFQNLVNSINAYDPRVSINLFLSTVIPDYDNNTYIARIAFYIKGLNGDFSVAQVI